MGEDGPLELKRGGNVEDDRVDGLVDVEGDLYGTRESESFKIGLDGEVVVLGAEVGPQGSVVSEGRGDRRAKRRGTYSTCSTRRLAGGAEDILAKVSTFANSEL